jgi:methionyl-tRNA formyltransferase
MEYRMIVFFGSGPVAAKSLALLIEYQPVEAVITKSTTEEEMKSVAQNIPVFCANTKSELDSIVSDEDFQSNLGILIDFGIIVSQKVIDNFEKGIVNSHFSLLPEWRGADPITFSVLSGQTKTGVSLMLIESGMDTGKIIVQKSLQISERETTATLTTKLITLSDELLKENLPKYITGQLKPRSQPHPDRATYSRKLTKTDGVLDFSKSAEVLEREIRAFLEWPKSKTVIEQKDVLITKASVDNSARGPVGTVYKTPGKTIGIYTKEGALIIEELKPAGKNAMSAEAFLAGYGSNLPLVQ